MINIVSRPEETARNQGIYTGRSTS